MRRVFARQNYHNAKVDDVNARCRERAVSRAIRNFAGFRGSRDREAEKNEHHLTTIVAGSSWLRSLARYASVKLYIYLNR